MARIVKHAKLHQTAFLLGFGDLSMTLPPTNKSLDLVMEYSPEGIQLTLVWAGATIHGIVPWANVAAATLGPAATGPKVTPKTKD